MRAEIDFSKESKDFCAFDSWNLRIFIFDNEDNLIEIRPFNDFELDKVKEMEIPILWKIDTGSCEIPVDDLIFFARMKVK